MLTQSQKIVDDLLPQIRLAALENQGACVMDVRLASAQRQRTVRII